MIGVCLGVSQYTVISVYCNTVQNYIVLRYKTYIPVYRVYIFFSRCTLVFHKTFNQNRITFLSQRLINHFSAPWPHHGILCLQIGGQHSTCGWISVFVWSFFSKNIPWQYIAIRIVIQLSCIAIYRNTLLPYRDTPSPLSINVSNKKWTLRKIRVGYNYFLTLGIEWFAKLHCTFNI